MSHSHADVEGLGVDEVLERGEGRAAFLSQAEHPLVREMAQLLEEEVVNVGVLVHAFCRDKKGGGGRRAVRFSRQEFDARIIEPWMTNVQCSQAFLPWSNGCVSRGGSSWPFVVHTKD